MKYAWDLPNSRLFVLEEDGRYGREVGHCRRYGDRHKEKGWYAELSNGEVIFNHNTQSYVFPDESMAMQAVLDAVEGKR